MADCSGTSLYRLRYRQVFVVDHRLKSSSCALFGRGDHRVSFSQRGQHLDRQSLEPSVTFGSLTPIPCLHLRRRQPRYLPHRLLPTTTTSSIDEDCTPIRHVAPVERSQPPRHLTRRTSLSSPQCHGRHTWCTLGCSACSCDVRGSATSPGRLDLMLPASDGEARNSGCLPVAVMVGEDAR